MDDWPELQRKLQDAQQNESNQPTLSSNTSGKIGGGSTLNLPDRNTWLSKDSSNSDNFSQDDDSLTSEEDQEEYSRLASVNNLNTAFYSTLIPNRDWESIDRLYKENMMFDVGDQTTNLMSNYGIALYLQGKIDDAIAQFNRALNRKDMFAEEEASWFLSLIYSERGDSDLAKFYEDKCRNSGGYSKPDFLDKGTEIVGNDAYFTRVFGKMNGSTLHAFIDFLTNGENRFSFLFSGMTSISSSMMGIAGDQLPSCAVCAERKLTGPQYSCSTCGRNPSNYVVLRPGAGVGPALTTELVLSDKVIGTLTMPWPEVSFRLSEEIFETLQGHDALKGRFFEEYYGELVMQYLRKLSPEVEPLYFGSIDTKFDARWSKSNNQFSSTFFSNHSEGIDSMTTVNYSKNTRPGDFDVFAYCVIGDRGESVPILILTLRKQFVLDIGYKSITLSPDDTAAMYQTWANNYALISEPESYATKIAISNSQVYATWSKNTSMGPLFQNDYEWMSLSWFALATLLDPTMDPYEAEPDAKANAYLIRGLLSLSKSTLSELNQP